MVDDNPNFRPLIDDFSAEIEDGVLLPVLTTSEAIHTARSNRIHVDKNITGTSLTSLVTKYIPLNQKQKLIVQRILSDALQWAQYPYDSTRRKQTLLYVGGEGGTGKSQIIRAIVHGMDLIGRSGQHWWEYVPYISGDLD